MTDFSFEELPWNDLFDRVNVSRPHRDLDGNPISLREWCVLVERGKQVVAQDRVGEYFLSTIWIGIDHGWNGPPLIYETMLFKGKDDVECYRYTTWTEAEQGHARLLDELKLIVAAS